MRRQLVIGNWKMHGDLLSNRSLLLGLAAADGCCGAESAVCVPFPYLAQVQSLLSASPVTWGAQNLSEFPAGAYTGEVSAAMLRDFCCRYVLVGHSERRAVFGETDGQVAGKFAAAIAAGLVPVLCVGETLAEHEAGRSHEVVLAQLEAVLLRVGVAAFAHAVLAYEPVWAIGTGRTASPGQAQEVHRVMRQRVAELDSRVAAGLRILYGGSVKAQNAGELFLMPDIDGGLVGGASLVLEEFLAICRAAR